MDQELDVKSWLTASVFEYACKNNYISVLEKILKDQDLLLGLHTNLKSSPVKQNARDKIKPAFILIAMLRRLLFSVETFAADVSSNCYPWNSDALPKIIKLLETTYEKCEFISLKKFFSLLTQLKFLDIMHLLRSKVESSALMQKLNLHFPRWQASQKSAMEKQFSIANPKILHKVEESYTQCRRLILKLSADPTYRALYMSQQFSDDMKKMMIESVIHLKEIIYNLSSHAGETIIEKTFSEQQMLTGSEDLGHQLLIDYLQPETSPETLLCFLDEMESNLAPPTGGFSSCLLPFDTLSEYSDVEMDSEYDESESDAEDSLDEKDKTITQSDEEHS